MFQAVVFLSGPSRSLVEERSFPWLRWQPLNGSLEANGDLQVYIADAGLESFLPWYENLSPDRQRCIKNIVWCGDGDSLGKHGAELRASTAARFSALWREHLYSKEKDFSDCAAVTSLLEYDLRHVGDGLQSAWIEVHGALGGRLDHQLANLFEFTASLGRMSATSAFILGPRNVITTLPLIGRAHVGELFSVSSLQANPTTAVKIEGAQYSGVIPLRQPSHGVSNVALAERIEIVPQNTSQPLMVMFSED